LNSSDIFNSSTSDLKDAPPSAKNTRGPRLIDKPPSESSHDTNGEISNENILSQNLSYHETNSKHSKSNSSLLVNSPENMDGFSLEEPYHFKMSSSAPITSASLLNRAISRITSIKSNAKFVEKNNNDFLNVNYNENGSKISFGPINIQHYYDSSFIERENISLEDELDDDNSDKSCRSSTRKMSNEDIFRMGTPVASNNKGKIISQSLDTNSTNDFELGQNALENCDELKINTNSPRSLRSCLERGKTSLNTSRHVFIKSSPQINMISPRDNVDTENEKASSIEINFNFSGEDFGDRTFTDQTQGTIFSMYTFFSISGKLIILYIAAYSILGASLRVLLSRLFGRDCEHPDIYSDFISKLSLCVTSSGRTEQRGGALFLDLPANIFGSFLIGMLTPRYKQIPAIPWLKSSHQCQQNLDMHIALRVGFCGSLTTFASWNTQMVVMMDGYNTVLGSQVVSSLFGYSLGMVWSLMSFYVGQHTSIWLTLWRNPHLVDNLRDGQKYSKQFTQQTLETQKQNFSFDTSLSEQNEEQGTIQKKNSKDLPYLIEFATLGKARTKEATNSVLNCINNIFHGKYSPFLFLSILIFIYVYGDSVWGSKFCQQLWIDSIFAPFGTLLRWKLSSLNGAILQNYRKFKWIPWGTLLTNVMGSIISVLCVTVLTINGDSSTTKVLVLGGLKTGFAGCLSTVSTFVKETAYLSERYRDKTRAYLYCIGTILVCSSLSVLVYSPIVR